MDRYRKKPVVIEAMRFRNFDTYLAICAWARRCGVGKDTTPSLGELFRFEGGPKPLMLVRTLEGTMAVNVGDWIIRGVEGEFYPCRDDIFEQTYEQAA